VWWSAKVRDGKGTTRYDALKDEYTGPGQSCAAIIDPTKVTRSALQNAAQREHSALNLRRHSSPTCPRTTRKKAAGGHGGYEDMY